MWADQTTGLGRERSAAFRARKRLGLPRRARLCVRRIHGFGVSSGMNTTYSPTLQVGLNQREPEGARIGVRNSGVSSRVECKRNVVRTVPPDRIHCEELPAGSERTVRTAVTQSENPVINHFVDAIAR